jgi:uncharacterized protein YbcI
MPLQKQSTAISNGIAALHREHYGRGAAKVRTTIHAEYVVTLLGDPFTPAERLTIANGEFRECETRARCSRIGCGSRSARWLRTRRDER